ILYRTSISELVVPYAETAETWNWRVAFDQGEFGMGRAAETLHKGIDVPEHAEVMDAVVNGRVRQGVVALYERDAGTLFTQGSRSHGPEVRRGRQLVIGFRFNVGNYDYGLNWTFHQDGTLEAIVEMSGAVLAKGVDDNLCPVCQQTPDEAGRITPTGGDR